MLLFIALIANSLVERQRLEIATLKSRGSTNTQIVMTYALQSITLGTIAFLLGLPLGRLAAQMVGGTRQFLTFKQSIPLNVAITNESIRFAGAAVLLALIATMAPTWQVSRLTIVTVKQAISRQLNTTSWRQAIMDVLLLGAAGYGYYLLREQGSIALLQFGEGTDPWENPLLFLTPALFLLASARVCLRGFVPAMKVLGGLIARLPGVTALLAIRNLERSSQRYATLILLLILTTGLGTFTASVARTLDENLSARTYYQVGADVALVEAVGKFDTGGSGSVAQGTAVGNTSSPGGSPAGLSGWAILPVSEHMRVPGVKAAARVGIFQATTRIGDRVITGQLYGIDRLDFPRVAYFRRDFAPESLGALMNALALEPSGILVQRSFLAQTGLQIGDPLRLQGLIAGSNQPLLFKIVGVVDLFPTAYPGESEFFVANLDYIFNELGGPVPYYVWLTVDKSLSSPELTKRLEKVGFRVLKIEDAREQVVREQARPERIGLFGFLSLGFLVTTLLSMLALGLHAFLVYRQRFIQLGIMRAIGLSTRQVAASLLGEEMLLTVLGILGGAALGLAASHLFIPFMQIGHTEVELIPPFEVIIAWRDAAYAVVALITASLLTTGGVIGLLSHLKVFQAIKLGEILN
ncbi:MAG: FtsX-like permease family protein [Anaerolineae bacterium]|nr:FtsX-like permease family protein [Anaerolineae bacterium]